MNKTYFGKKIVEKDTKKTLVKNLFNNVSLTYDLMNDLMSLGLHRLWKKDLLKNIKEKNPTLIIDLAGGTGDISLLLSKKFPSSTILVYDLSFAMIENSKKKLIKSNVKLINGSAEFMAFPDNSVDIITLSFGLRNFSNIEKSIKECNRILKYGGKLYCLEFSPSFNHSIKPFYDFYSYKLIPKIGKVIANNEGAYQYLTDSIRNFPHNPELKNIFNNNGFFCYSDKSYLGGIAILNIFSKV